jgi:hypothetical protein
MRGKDNSNTRSGPTEPLRPLLRLGGRALGIDRALDQYRFDDAMLGV